MNRKLLLVGMLVLSSFAGAAALAQESEATEEARLETERARAEARHAEADAARTEAQTAAQIAQAEAAAAQVARTEAELERARRRLAEARSELEEAARVIAVRTAPVPAERNAVILRAGGAGAQARLGAVVTDARDGALVTRLLPSGNASAAGLEVGDVILSVEGVALAEGDSSPHERLIEELADVEPGAIVALVVERGGDSIELDVETSSGPVTTFPDLYSRELELRVLQDELGSAGRIVTTARRNLEAVRPNLEIVRTLGFAASPWGDMELVEMTEGLARYFGTSEGLLVVRAPEDDGIGIEDGDVILSISGRTPNSPAHALRILGSFEPDETIDFGIMRDGSRTSVAYAVPRETAAGSEPPVRVLPD